jgi:tetratricopeptide (TPR) repeat protein
MLANARVNKNAKTFGYSYHGIGQVYFLTGNYSTALEYQLKALKIADSIGDKLLSSTILLELSNSCYAQNSVNCAIRC